MVLNAPSKHYREGIALIELTELFPDEESARTWFESIIWPNGPVCPHCGSARYSECKNHKPMPYRCKTCRKHFSVRQGTILEASNIKLRMWVFAIGLCITGLKSVSSMKLHRDLGITQKSAWFMMRRIREAYTFEETEFAGPVEIDETYMGGGKRKNGPKSKHKELTRRGTVGKTAVVGIKNTETKQVIAKEVDSTSAETLHVGSFGKLLPMVANSARMQRLPNHESVRH